MPASQAGCLEEFCEDALDFEWHFEAMVRQGVCRPQSLQTSRALDLWLQDTPTSAPNNHKSHNHKAIGCLPSEDSRTSHQRSWWLQKPEPSPLSPKPRPCNEMIRLSSEQEPKIILLRPSQRGSSTSCSAKAKSRTCTQRLLDFALPLSLSLAPSLSLSLLSGEAVAVFFCTRYLAMINWRKTFKAFTCKFPFRGGHLYPCASITSSHSK